MHTQLSLRERRKQLGLVPGAGSQPTPQFWGIPFASSGGHTTVVFGNLGFPHTRLDYPFKVVSLVHNS